MAKEHKITTSMQIQHPVDTIIVPVTCQHCQQGVQLSVEVRAVLPMDPEEMDTFTLIRSSTMPLFIDTIYDLMSRRDISTNEAIARIRAALESLAEEEQP